VAWAHILDEKRKALQPKSEKCIFVGYSEGVNGYRLLQPYSNEIIIRIDVKFDENLLACKPNLAFVSSSTYDSSSMFVPFSIPIMVSSSSDDDNVDENPRLLAHLPPYEFIEHEPTSTPPLPKWVCSTREATGDLTGDPSNQLRTRSQFQRASSLLAQVLETHDP
jgi:hypothetical protein